MKSKKKNSKRSHSNKTWVGYNQTRLKQLDTNKFAKKGIFQKLQKLFRKRMTNK